MSMKHFWYATKDSTTWSRVAESSLPPIGCLSRINRESSVPSSFSRAIACTGKEFIETVTESSIMESSSEKLSSDPCGSSELVRDDLEEHTLAGSVL